MNFLYVDNFRGFSNSIIPILDVNFLVGENSTGKTSILGLIKLISEPNFWFSTELDIRRVGFGTFRDVVSINSNNKRHFSIGFIIDTKPIKSKREEKSNTDKHNSNNVDVDKNLMTSVVATYKKYEGMPKLSSLIMRRKNIDTMVKLSGEKLKFKTRNVENDCSADKFVHTIFPGWLEKFKTDNSGFMTLGLEQEPFKGAPFIFFLSMIERIHDDHDDVKSLLQLPFDMPSPFFDMTWLAPIRSKPRKTYDEFRLDFSPEGEHTPYLIKKRLDSDSQTVDFVKTLTEFGEISGLFKKIEIKNYGRGTTDPFELDVILDEKPLSIKNVGYGVSQSLPVVVEMFTRSPRSWFAIQQPEVHMHPKAQAALGELFFNLSVSEGKKFIVETHSDYTIDRFRILIKKKRKGPKSQVLFFERTETGNKVTPIEIDDSGEFVPGQPDSYREFFIKEEMDMLGL